MRYDTTSINLNFSRWGMENRPTFGTARDFYYVRLLHVHEVEPAELDWNEETWIFGPGSFEPGVTERWVIALFDTFSGEEVARMSFATKNDARLKLMEVSDDLETMEKAEFDERYLRPRG